MYAGVLSLFALVASLFYISVTSLFLHILSPISLLHMWFNI